MRNGHAFADGSTAETLARHQGIEDRVGVEFRVASCEAVSKQLQRALLARCNEPGDGAFGGKEPIEVHGRIIYASRLLYGTSVQVAWASKKGRNGFRACPRRRGRWGVGRGRPPRASAYCLATAR